MFVRILGAKVFYLIENKKEKGRKFVSFNLSMLFFLRDVSGTSSSILYIGRNIEVNNPSQKIFFNSTQ